MSKYQAYPEYKDSGEEWLGQVPSHWKVIQIKHLSVVRRGASPRPIDDPKYFDDDGEYAWTRIADVTASDVYLNNAPQRLSCLGSSLSVKLEPGALFLSIAGTVGKPCITGIKACIHDGFVYFPELKVPNKFLFYVFAGEQAYKGLGKFGTQLNLNTDTVGGIKIGCAPNDELESIIRFLDYETAKIDTLIDKQQQLIQLLKEKRQAVISHAVTKGLNPNAPMRDSGVEWLGEVPEHWSLPKIKWFYKTESGGTPNTSKYEEYYQDGDISWIRSTDLNNGELFETPIAITSKAIRESACTIIPINSVLIAMYGGAGTIGKHSLLKFESAINQAVCAILPSEKIHPDFLHLYIEFYRPYWMAGAEGARKDPNINQETIRELVVSCPPADEQIEIFGNAQHKLAVIDQTVSKCEKNIQLMQERRTALISAAVTGKIDVRHHASRPAGDLRSSKSSVHADL